MSSDAHIFDTYFVTTAVIAPLSTLLIAAIFAFGALYSRYRAAFSLISLGGLFMLLSQIYWLLLQLQRSFGLMLLSKEAAQALFTPQAILLYLGLAVVLAGDAMLVWQVTRPDATRHI